jgi:predicted DNA-binding protein
MKKTDTTQVAFRIPREWIRRADTIAKKLSRPGLEASRTDALRAALALGFEALTNEKNAA